MITLSPSGMRYVLDCDLCRRPFDTGFTCYDDPRRIRDEAERKGWKTRMVPKLGKEFHACPACKVYF